MKKRTWLKQGLVLLTAGVLILTAGTAARTLWVRRAPSDLYDREQPGLPKETGAPGPEETAFSEPEWQCFYTDPMLSCQWAAVNSGTLSLVPDEPSEDADGDGVIASRKGIDMRLPEAWKIYDSLEKKRTVVVALIDTGVDYTHPDLEDAIWTNPGEIPDDGIDNDGNGYIDDICGWNFCDGNPEVFSLKDGEHGTHAAGIIAAARNGEGTVGICDPEYVKIMVLKTLGSEKGLGRVEHVAEAIRYAEKNGADICNLSFGTPVYSEELYQVMRGSDLLFVVAAGNGTEEDPGRSIDETPMYPASFDLEQVISVANLRFDGRLDPGSDYGAVSVDIAAPGSYIMSTVPGDDYGYMSGTSMAAPMVTGGAALLCSADPELTPAEAGQRILETARKLPDLEGKVACGGMPDLEAAILLSHFD